MTLKILYVVFLVVVAKGINGLVCNGMAGLCKLKFNQVTLAGSHNSGANRVMKYGSWPYAPALSCFYRNQDYSFTGQLDFGIRFFDIDTWYRSKKVYTSHNNAYGQPLDQVLKQIANWLNQGNHRNEVIAMRFQDTRGSYSISNLDPLLMSAFSGSGGKVGMNRVQNGQWNTWPTLEQTINDNARVFVFIKDAICDAKCRKSSTYSRAMTVTDTWLNMKLTSSCGGMPSQTEAKCRSHQQPLLLLSAFASLGLCVSDLQKKCNPHIISSTERCFDVIKSRGKTVNFVTADYVNQAKSSQSVVEAARRLNIKNIQQFG